MAVIGQRNRLTILYETDSGYYLDGEELGEILLPGKYIPRGSRPGEIVDVFLYRDSEDRLVATTEYPLAMVGQFASLRVVGMNPRVGCFLDWGLAKDLLLPIREQKEGLEMGYWVVVAVLLDQQTDRLVASARISRHLDLTPPNYHEGEEVELLIIGATDLGFKAIVNNAHTGLLYRAEVAGELKMGQKMNGYIRAVREDGKIDLGLDRAGHRRITDYQGDIIESLEAAGGAMEYDDKSTPEEIREVFGMSKKAFKQAIGTLFKARRIMIANGGIRLVAPKK